MNRSHKPLRLLIAGGGTGGHLFPGLAIAEAFQDARSCDIRFVGTKRGLENRVIPKQGYRLYRLPVAGLYRVGIKRQLTTLIKLPIACLKSGWILISFRPQLVIGIGGYASGPLVAMAILMHRRTILQEQNAYPGMTNRILGRLVPLSFVPFPGMDRLFRKSVVVGNPIRKAITSMARCNDERKGYPPVITVLGGSQGAQVLNRTLMEMLPSIAGLPFAVNVIHQTGARHFETIQAAYRQFPDLQADVRPFFDDIEHVYHKSRLIVCRAGSIVNEIIAVGRASILVPIAISRGTHQPENAKTMVAQGAALMMEERTLKAEALFQAIKALLAAPEQIEKMEKAARALYQGDAAAAIVSHTLAFYRL